MIKNEKIKIYSDYFSCFNVDSFDGLPAMLPGQLEEEMSRVGEKSWMQQAKLNLQDWLDTETQKLYDKFGISEAPIEPKVKRTLHKGYITAEIQWKIPQMETIPA